jgi:hypothetical protein
MGEQMSGGLSNRQKVTLGGTLGVIASIATILSFLLALGNHPGHPHPGQTYPAVSSYSPSPPPSTVVPSTASSTPAVLSTYPASAQNSILSECEAANAAPASYCQCNVSWVEANVPYSMFVQDPAMWEQEADGYATC